METLHTIGLFAANGYCPLPESLTADRTAAIVVESKALAPCARRVRRKHYCLNGDRSISSPRCLSTVAAGPVLKAIHGDEHYLDLLKSVVGRRLSPTRACYIYYEPGDYIGLHKDSSICEITLITGIAGALHPLVVHPSLVGMPPEELVAISRTYSAMPPGGARIAVPKAGGFLMLLGSKIPHHRPAVLDSCTIATLCYA